MGIKQFRAFALETMCKQDEFGHGPMNSVSFRLIGSDYLITKTGSGFVLQENNRYNKLFKDLNSLFRYIFEMRLISYN